ncbi:fluoroquinolone transport system permease protein [Paenibacillus endophyticus]|uniref:Fluoroquinolone transport system permease protein n=1 Tax=Paenibacillus endophyticus TaxID=1294268 RepID=A0A7W5GDI1_9BACL|nr:hypothetical protein [Paenibacillus endophyticus]MBB3155935.1 fluoroquinolone transport system permease protein [Paenibacillus endophyticus]
MMKLLALTKNDARQIWKDPLLMASLLGPLVLIVFARFIIPPLSGWVEQHYGFPVIDYFDFIAVILLLTIPLLSGTMAGLLMLDERDENMIAYYAITPLTRKGYFIYRLYGPVLLSIGLSSLFFLWSGITEVQIEGLYFVILLTIEALCMALFLAAFAANKVEGLALSKISGLLFAGPIIAAFAPFPWSYVGAWIPTYWPAKSYLLAVSEKPFLSFGSFIIGLVLHLILLNGMLRSFLKRMD